MTQVGGNHYQADEIGIEPFEVIDAWSEYWPSGTEFYLGSALKYIARCGVKNDGKNAKDDLLKAAHYLREAAARTSGPLPVEAKGEAKGDGEAFGPAAQNRLSWLGQVMHVGESNRNKTAIEYINELYNTEHQ